MAKGRSLSLLLVPLMLTAQSPHPVDMDQSVFVATPQLQQMRAREDVAAIRRHAWALFRAINQPVSPAFPFTLSKVPVWLTWSSQEEVFAHAPHDFFERLNVLGQAKIFADSLLLQSQPGVEAAPANAVAGIIAPAADKSIMTPIPLSTVFFNPASAAAMIKSTPVVGLPSVSVTPIVPNTVVAAQQQFAARGVNGASRQIAPFPDNSVVIKTAWYLVSSILWESNPIPVWHGPPATDPSQVARADLWPDHIRVNPLKAKHACPRPVPRSCPTIIPPATATPSTGVAKLPEISLDRFFYVPVCTCEQAVAINSKITFGVFPGDYVVLMGLHLTTREIPEWVWATFWWTDRGQAQFLANQPPFLSAPWKNYRMDTTLDMVTPRESDAKPKAIYNPWLEATSLPLKIAMASNCMNCHRTAAYPRVQFPPPRGFIDPGLGELGDSIKLDFLWSIANQFDPPAKAAGGSAPIVPH